MMIDMRKVDGMMAADTAGLAAQRYVYVPNNPPIWRAELDECNSLTRLLSQSSVDTVIVTTAAIEMVIADAIVP